MKPAYIALIVLGLIAVGGVVYVATRPRASAGALLPSDGGPAVGGDQTARDVGAVASGVGTGLGGLLSGIADLIRAGRTPEQTENERDVEAAT